MSITAETAAQASIVDDFATVPSDPAYGKIAQKRLRVYHAKSRKTENRRKNIRKTENILVI